MDETQAKGHHTMKRRVGLSLFILLTFGHLAFAHEGLVVHNTGKNDAGTDPASDFW